MAGTGGKRPGSGRPRGAKSAHPKSAVAREVTKKALRAEVTPLDVMLKAMRNALSKDDLAAAHGFAKDAAPYIHPKLIAQKTEHSGPNDGPVEIEHSFGLRVFEGGRPLEPKD